MKSSSNGRTIAWNTLSGGKRDVKSKERKKQTITITEHPHFNMKVLLSTHFQL